MEKSNNNYLGIIGCAILYAVTSFACAFLGFLNPWCWIVVFPVLAAVLGAPSYFWAASKWQQFGVGMLFALTLAIILFVMSEIDFTQVLLMIAVGVVSDVMHQAIGNTHKRSILLAYPILPLCIIVWLMKLWTASEWYYQGAAEEISIDYAEGLKTLSSSWALALVIILTLAAGYSAIRIVSWLKKA